MAGLASLMSAMTSGDLPPMPCSLCKIELDNEAAAMAADGDTAGAHIPQPDRAVAIILGTPVCRMHGTTLADILYNLPGAE
jgi:hypothetical protein